MSFDLPSVPVAHKDFVSYLASKPNTPLRDLVKPYNEYEARLRQGFAQHREHPSIQNAHVNAVPIFTGHEHTLNIRARDPEQDHEAERYIMPLKPKVRRANGSPAMVQNMKEFKENFDIFSERSLVDLDWNNIVVAGSSVVTAMLPVAPKHTSSKRALREYYHQQLAPSSDVDIFLWGLDEQAAIAKIAQIEECVRNSILAETTTIRTKNAITIASQYPTRHIQIVLRLYKSVSEILTGFDVDCSCFAFDGNQVYATPRGITSFCSQANTIDLSRRSPSYESRLAKYAHRGFEVYFAELDRKRIDPTLYDRSFVRTMGLARLLMLERLPKESDREAYLNQRRQERGRPILDTWRNKKRQLPGNMKDKDPEDVPEWDLEADVSNYHTFTVPYGPKYHAKKIERLLYIKDLLLNAEWNTKKDRSVNLHRHPCFIGDVAHIVNDCCGECPVPTSEEEIEVAEEERKVYVHGEISFMKDDPGRQSIGSFHPLTADDWTDMAYLGNTQELCAAIIDGDTDAVKQWCSREENDVNKRDHTGRTPLQLAVMCGNIDAMKILMDNGARIIARIADGFTALHMAAAIGRADMIKLLAAKSDENEELEAEKQDARKAARRSKQERTLADTQMTDVQHDGESDAEMIDVDENEQDDNDAMTQGSFVKVTEASSDVTANSAESNEDLFGPDVYDANILAWDTPVSPLHVAILAGQIEAVEALVSDFGADLLLPIKLKNSYNGEVNYAILNLALASMVSITHNGPAMVKKLIDLGAKPSQSDVREVSGFHGAVILNNVEALKAMIENDLPSSNIAINHLSRNGNSGYYNFQIFSPLITAITQENAEMARFLLEAGAAPTITYENFREVYLRMKEEERKRWPHLQAPDDSEIRTKYRTECEQPIIAAIGLGQVDIVKSLLDRGADVNTIDTNGGKVLEEQHSSHLTGRTALDIIRDHIESFKTVHHEPVKPHLPTLQNDDEYLQGLEPGSYRHTMVLRNIELAKMVAKQKNDEYLEQCKQYKSVEQTKQREEAMLRLKEFEDFALALVERGGKGFYDLHPRKSAPQNNNGNQNSGENKRKHDQMESAHYEVRTTFRDPRLDETKKEAYLKLFNAVWDGNAGIVKELTMKPIEDGHGKQIPPVPIAVMDGFGLNPLAIAIAKGNLQLAQIILDIAAAQFQPSKDENGEVPKRRFRILDADDEDGYESDGASEDGDVTGDIHVMSELIDDKFTIDDLGQLSETVGSTVDPKTLLTWTTSVWAVNGDPSQSFKNARRTYEREWNLSMHSGVQNNYMKYFVALIRTNTGGPSLLDYAVTNGDLAATKFLMKASREFAPKVAEGSKSDITKRECWSLWQLHEALHKSVRSGKMDIAEYLITEHGAGMPMDELAKDVEIPDEEREKPQYYQGLKLYGKHKAAWARQAAGEHGNQYEDWRNLSPAPFLKAVYLENRASIEFWQSDACSRMYETFGQRNQNVKEVQLLARKHGSWSSFVISWLGLRRDLALHCAVIRGSRKSQRSEVVESTKYLMETVPRSLQTKSIGGQDPLWLAFFYRQAANAKLFIEAGADQNTRDGMGMNIIHALLSLQVTEPPNAKEAVEKDLAKIEELLKLVDPRVLPALWTDRSSEGPSGLTPFAQLVNTHPPSIEYFNLLDKYMPTEEVLSMYDGSGQTPVHRMVIDGMVLANRRLLRAVFTAYPQLLALENAAGQTPLDLISTFYIREKTSTAPEVPHRWRGRNHPNLLRRNTSQSSEEEDTKRWQDVLFELLGDMENEHKSKHGALALKRRMISVRDASEVAKRLAEKQKKPLGRQSYGYGYGYRRHHRIRKLKVDDLMDEEDEEPPHDEVERWHQGGIGFNNGMNGIFGMQQYVYN